MPLVISKKPLIKGGAKDVSILNACRIGAKQLDKIWIIPLDFKIDITLENITTNPPISRIVEIELLILSAKISPKLANETSLVLLSFNIFLFEYSQELFPRFQKRKINPTVIQAKM